MTSLKTKLIVCGTRERRDVRYNEVLKQFWHHCGYCDWSLIWSVRHIPLFLYIGTIVVFEKELGIYPWTIHMFKQFTEKKMQRFICIQQVLCRNTIRPWRFVQGQLLKKCCRGDKRAHGHFKTQIVLLAVYAVFHRLCRPIARVFRVWNRVWMTKMTSRGSTEYWNWLSAMYRCA